MRIRHVSDQVAVVLRRRGTDATPHSRTDTSAYVCTDTSAYACTDPGPDGPADTGAHAYAGSYPGSVGASDGPSHAEGHDGADRDAATHRDDGSGANGIDIRHAWRNGISLRARRTGSRRRSDREAERRADA